MADPLTNIIADGRLTTRPTRHYGLPEIITVDLDLMAASLSNRLFDILSGNPRLRTCYGGFTAYTTQQITNDIISMVDYLIGQTYNKLRSILERTHPQMRVARMNTRCPVSASQEFPAWLSSTLACIGPCRVIDGPLDTLVVYASTAATMNNYGRANPVVFNSGNYERLMSALRELNVAMAPFDHRGEHGSYFPMIDVSIGENVWSAFGLVHSSHFENEDIARIALVTSNLAVTPFEKVGMTIGYVNDEATLNALAAVAAPENIPAGQTAISAGRPVGHHFRVNYFGILPAVAAAGAEPARPRGMYVIGRGMQRYYQCRLASELSTTEILEIIRFRVLRTTPPPTTT